MLRREFIAGAGGLMLLKGSAFGAVPAAPKELAKAKPKLRARKSRPVNLDIMEPKPPVPGLHYRGPKDATVVSFTFDDGPRPGRTELALRILAEHGVKATFFLLGRGVLAYPKIVHMIHDQGHELANHTWSHPNLRKIPIERAESEIVKCQCAFQKVIGFRPGLFRPPYGAFNRRVVEVARKHGLETVTWTTCSTDWASKATPQSIVKQITDGAGNGVIFLLHDPNPKLGKALPKILEAIKAQGYTTKPACELLGVKAVIA